MRSAHARDLGRLAALALLLFVAFGAGYFGQDIEAQVRQAVESQRGGEGPMTVAFTGGLDGVLAVEAIADGVLVSEGVRAAALQDAFDPAALDAAIVDALGEQSARMEGAASGLAEARATVGARASASPGVAGDLLWAEEAYAETAGFLSGAAQAGTVGLSDEEAEALAGLVRTRGETSGERRPVDQAVRRLAGRVQAGGPYILPSDAVQRVLWDESGRRLARFGSGGSGGAAAQSSVYARLRSLLDRKDTIGAASWPDEADAAVARVLRVGVGSGSRGPVTVETQLSVPGWELLEPEADLVLRISGSNVSAELEGRYRAGADLAARISGELEGSATPDGMLRAQGRYEFVQQGDRAIFTETGNAYLVGLRTRYDTYLGSIRLEADGAELDREPTVVLWRSDDAGPRRR